MKKYKIIYCIDNYWGRSGAGASMALRSLIMMNPQLEKYKFFCKRYIEGNLKDIVPVVATGKEVVDEFLNDNYQCIHWIRSNNYCLYTEIVHEMKSRNLKIPIISTICQQPTAPNLFLTPIEVKYPSRIIFIDNTAYYNKAIKFIPLSRRKMIRFGGWTKESKETYDKILAQTIEPQDKDMIVYGRGSSLNKCPRNMFQIFDEIAPPKKFIIVGSGGSEEKKWIQEEIARRRGRYEILLLDAMPYQKWLEMVATFDIFLYHLPLDAYSSTDGTMANAMWLKKPVVYFGPEAPKEKLKDNYNSRIAQSENDIVICCNELASNRVKRLRLGENARLTMEANQTYSQFLEKINKLYEEVTPLSPLRLSLCYMYLYTSYMLMRDKMWPFKIIKRKIDRIRVYLALGTRIRSLSRNI